MKSKSSELIFTPFIWVRCKSCKTQIQMSAPGISKLFYISTEIMSKEQVEQIFSYKVKFVRMNSNLQFRATCRQCFGQTISELANHKFPITFSSVLKYVQVKRNLLRPFIERKGGMMLEKKNGLVDNLSKSQNHCKQPNTRTNISPPANKTKPTFTPLSKEKALPIYKERNFNKLIKRVKTQKDLVSPNSKIENLFLSTKLKLEGLKQEGSKITKEAIKEIYGCPQWIDKNCGKSSSRDHELYTTKTHKTILIGCPKCLRLECLSIKK